MSPELGISRKQTLQQAQIYKAKYAAHTEENWREMTRCFGLVGSRVTGGDLGLETR